MILGNGINPNLQVGEEYTINVDTHEAGPGAVTGRIRSTLGNDLDLDIIDNEDGTFNLYYTPHNPGNYVIKVKFGGQDIPGGDFVVTVSLKSEEKKSEFSSLFLFAEKYFPLIN
jgi:filamin